MRRALLAAAVVGACAAEKKQVRGEDPMAAQAAAAEAQRAAMQIQEARTQALAACAALQNRYVDWAEENFMGTALALNRVKNGRGIYDPAAPVQAYVQGVGLALAQHSPRPSMQWTFGVINDEKPRAVSEIGGYVFVTTGLLAKLENEAQLAATLAHEIVHATNGDRLREYQAARYQACDTGLTGAMLVQMNAGTVPGATDFVNNSQFFKTMSALAAADPVDISKDPKVDMAFVLWFINQVADSRKLTGQQKDDEVAADRAAVELLHKAGYDPRALGPVLALVDEQEDPKRAEQVAKIPPGMKGKLPPLPKDLVMPPP